MPVGSWGWLVTSPGKPQLLLAGGGSIAAPDGFEQGSPIFVFLEVIIPGDNVVFRFVRNSKPVDFQTDTGGADLTWEASNFGIEAILQDNTGGQPELKITVENVTRKMQSALEQVQLAVREAMSAL